MEDFKNEKKNAPEGEVNEKELKELADTESAGGAIPVTVPITIAASTAFCPTVKCSSKC